MAKTRPASTAGQALTPADPPSEPCWTCRSRRFFARAAAPVVWICAGCHPPVEPAAMVFHEIADGRPPLGEDEVEL